MAGGNISPRQKMINMMYLVLTALLAMNVSAEILEAFVSFRDSLRSSSEKFSHKNNDTKAAIIAKVNEEIETGNTKNAYVKDLAEQVSSKTNETIKFISDLGAVLEGPEIANVDPETGEIENKKETEGNYRFWMGAGSKDAANGGRGDGEAIKLRKHLNGYAEWANEFISSNDSAGQYDVTFEEICVDPKDNPDIPSTSENKQKPWEYFTFHSKPVVADLAMLEKWKMDVNEVEYELLTFLKAKLGQVTFKIDSLIAISAPVSQVVAAGMKFETSLFVAMSSSEITPEFSGSGAIKTSADGNSATMTIQARGGFAKGTNSREQSYQAIIKVPRADGGIEELTVNGKFTVRKPEVVITSASVQNLYWNCGNSLNVDVPALGDLYNPVFKASSAAALPSPKDKRKVTIVPTGRRCILSVSSNTNGQLIKIDDISYKVIKPPKPDIVLLVNGKEYNGAAPISKKSNCVVKIRPDADFLSALPLDARYLISRIDLLSQRSLGAPSKVGVFNGAGKDGTRGIPIKLGNKLKSDSPGTKIYFKIDKVYRINFQNKKIAEKYSDRDLYIGAVIK